MDKNTADGVKAAYDSSSEMAIDDESRIVILSDLHMGSGGRYDDFKKNSELFREALGEFYLKRGYALILNGDVEELLRVDQKAIRTRWVGLFGLFSAFAEGKGLIRIRGNHDYSADEGGYLKPSEYLEGLRLVHPSGTLFVFHGHQAGSINSGRYNTFISAILRIFANTLGIRNYSVAMDSTKKIRVERLVYEFSRSLGIASAIGHTHRPLFESLSKREDLRLRIEGLCARYAKAKSVRKKAAIKEELDGLKNAWRELRAKPKEKHLANLVYDDLLVPCLFNSGCCIGKRGFTALEIRNGRIALVQWIRPQRGTERREHLTKDNSERIVLRKTRLSRIFTRIDLLR